VPVSDARILTAAGPRDVPFRWSAKAHNSVLIGALDGDEGADPRATRAQGSGHSAPVLVRPGGHVG
jgi:hypothetical protein